MSKALEALDIIAETRLSHMEYDCDENYEGEWEYEAVEVDDGDIKDCYPEEIETLKKALEALEVIKDKRVDVYCLLESDNLEEYNKNEYIAGEQILIQEEYNLVKEVLHNEK